MKILTKEQVNGMNYPGISCYMPTRSLPKGMHDEAVACFLMQDWPGPKELIVYNNDPTIELSCNHPQVKVINEDRNGRSLQELFDVAISHCQYDVLAVWEDDDIRLPNHLSLMYRKMIELGGEAIRPRKYWYLEANEVKEWSGNGPAQSAWVLTKDIVRRVGGYPKTFGNWDYALWELFDKHGKAVVFENTPEETTFMYRWCSDSIHLSGYGLNPKGLDLVAEDQVQYQSSGHHVFGKYEIIPNLKANYSGMARDFIDTLKPKDAPTTTKEIGPLLTIGMASYNNKEDVWWTIQALRMTQDLTDCEILVIDNFGDKSLQEWITVWCPDQVRCVEYKDIRGTTLSRQKIFEEARGKFVLCIDSHVMLDLGVIETLKNWIIDNDGCPDLIQGPMMYDSLKAYVTHLDPVWQASMYGVWGDHILKENLPTDPFEIGMMGLGLFGSFKDQWLGFNEQCIGFGGEEGYIHEKYRQAGRRTLCLPWLTWLHKFHDEKKALPYPNFMEERIRNYILNWKELGLSLDDIKNHFGPEYVQSIIDQGGL